MNEPGVVAGGFVAEGEGQGRATRGGKRAAKWMASGAQECGYGATGMVIYPTVASPLSFPRVGSHGRRVGGEEGKDERRMHLRTGYISRLYRSRSWRSWLSSGPRDSVFLTR